MTTQTIDTQTAGPAVWTIDPTHTSAEFAVRHLMLSTVKGRFGSVEATLRGDPREPLSGTAEAVIDVSSIDTGNAERDAHLRSADFFDVENYPSLRYVSRALRQTGERDFEVDGELTIRDVTRAVTLSVTFEGLVKDPWGNERIGLSAEGKIKRTDFGLKWNMALEAGGVVVGEDVRIVLQVEAVRQAA